MHYQRLWEDNINIHGKSVTVGAYARHTDERANDGATTVAREGRESEGLADVAAGPAVIADNMRACETNRDRLPLVCRRRRDRAPLARS